MKRTLAANTFMVSFFQGLGVASAFAVDVGIATLFGLGQRTDAFFVAVALPVLSYAIFNRVAELALVPVFFGWRHRLGQTAWDHFTVLLGLTFVVLLPVPLVGLALPQLFVVPLAPGFGSATRELTVQLIRPMLFLIPVNGLIALSRAMLNSMESFVSSTSSKGLGNLVVLAFLAWAFFGERSIGKIATGYLAAGVAQCGLLIMSLRRSGFRFRFASDPLNGEIRAAFTAVTFPLLSFSVNQGNEVLERFLTSFLPAGSLSALIYARRIIAAVVNVFLNSIASAIMPSLADDAGQADTTRLVLTVRRGVRMIMSIGLPLTAVLVVLGGPLVGLVFLRGAMTETSVQLITSLVLVYSLALPFLGLNQLLVSPHYAMGDTRTPAMHLLLMMMLKLAFDTLLFFLLGIFGFPVAMLLTGILSVLRALWLLERRGLSVVDSQVLGVAWKLLVASSAMGAVMHLLYRRWAGSPLQAGIWMQLAPLVLAAGVGAIALFLACQVLGLKPAELLGSSAGGSRVEGRRHVSKQDPLR